MTTTSYPWIVPSSDIRVTDIIIGERRREELGDIEALAESIKAYGLLHPIVLSSSGVEDRMVFTLVAGFRRLEAVKRLGWERIPYTSVGALSERELREIELEENIRRKDFTEYERSRDMVALAEMVAERLTEEAAQNLEPRFCSTVEQNPPERDVGGRPAKPSNLRAVANEIGASPASIVNARAHVAAVEQFPALRDAPKMTAISIARDAAKLPEPERPAYVESQQQYDRKYKAVFKRLREATSYDFCVDATEADMDEWLSDYFMGDVQGELDDCLSNISQSIERLTRIKSHLFGRRNRLTLVKGGKAP